MEHAGIVRKTTGAVSPLRVSRHTLRGSRLAGVHRTVAIRNTTPQEEYGVADAIPLDRIGEGMILAEDLLGANGNVLLPKGSVVTSSIAARLRKIGIEAVPVAAPLSENERKQVRDQRRAVIEKKFEGTESSPLMREIKRISLECLPEQ